MIKQREANSWKSVSYAKSITGAQTYTKFPIVLRTTEQSIPTWSVKGNTTTSGTPTPSNPVSVNGVGERTENDWNGEGFSARAIDYTHGHTNTNTYGTTLSSTTGKEVSITQTDYPTGNVGYQNGFFFIDVDFSEYSIGDVITLSFDYIVDEVHALSTQTSTTLYAGKNNNAIAPSLSSGDWKLSGRLTATITIISDMKPYVEVRLCGNSITVKNIMLNSGSTALPYEPYGFKIPIVSNQTALTPVYLTEQLMLISTYADSLASSGTMTRNTKKLVLTGNENWKKSSTYDGSFYAAILSNSTSPYQNNILICTHAVHVNPINSTTYTYGKCGTDRSQGEVNVNLNLFIGQAGWSVSDFQAYLAQEYTNGTPVTVWYVLATPKTEQVTVPTIPTTSSPTTIDVNTSVKPSEMSLTYDGYKICKPTKIVIPEPSEWIAKSWNGYNGMVGSSIWSDGDNIYYSMAMYQYILNKSTSTWSDKTWNGLTSFNGANIWTDGDNIYYSFGNDQYVLNRQTSTWSAKTWNGLASFDGGYVWTDGNNVYYSRSSNQYILDKATSTWVEKEWNGLTSFDGSSVWFEGNNIYYSYGLTRYVLNKSTSTWSEKVWTSAPYNMDGSKIWSVNGYTFYSNGTYEQYVLDKSTSTWSTKTWTGFTSFRGRNIWTDGTNIYVSDGIGKQYVLVR